MRVRTTGLDKTLGLKDALLTLEQIMDYLGIESVHVFRYRMQNHSSFCAIVGVSG
jgi:hypothetical protein